MGNNVSFLTFLHSRTVPCYAYDLKWFDILYRARCLWPVVQCRAVSEVYARFATRYDDRSTVAREIIIRDIVTRKPHRALMPNDDELTNLEMGGWSFG